MPTFPYFDILKKAYGLTLRNIWLWIFGLFIGGTASFNFVVLNYFFFPQDQKNFERFAGTLKGFWRWISGNSEFFPLLILLAFFVATILVVFAGLARGAVIWATDQLALRKPVDFKKALQKSTGYFWQITVLQLTVTMAFFLLFLLFFIPTSYLFSVNAIGRGVILSLSGLIIFIPAGVVFGFLHLYGPIFIVLYNTNLQRALTLSFNLLRHKLWESIILAAFLMGLSALFIFGVIFSIILVSAPIALLIVLLLQSGLNLVAMVLVGIFVFLLIAYLIVLNAGLAVFQNVAWVLAVREMVKTVKFAKKAESLALEAI